MGSLSLHRDSMRASASSKRSYIVNDIPTAKPRNIFSCCVSLAYCKIKDVVVIKIKTELCLLLVAV